MFRFVGLVTSILPILTCFTAAQESQSTVNLFLGYQYTHVALGHDINGFDLNGWNISGNVFLNRYLGVSADFSGNYGSPRISALNANISTQTYTYLAGPIVRVPISYKITPFAHLLFGGPHINSNSFRLEGTDNSFSWAVGGGVDAEIHPHIALRLGQADWLRTQLVDSTQSNRYSAGLVFKY